MSAIMRSTRVLAAIGLLLTSCRQSPAPFTETTAADLGTLETPRAPEARQPGTCWTLLDAEEPDVLRVVGANTILYANPQVGLSIVDVTDLERPRTLATSAAVGTPLGVFVWRDVAVYVVVPWTRPSETIVRAVSLAPGREGALLGEIRLAGRARDARRAGETLVVTRDLPGPGEPMTAVDAIYLDDTGPKQTDEVRLTGDGALVMGSPFGVVVARRAEPAHGPDRSALTWIALPPDAPGHLKREGTSIVNGVVPRWRDASAHMIDVTEDARVRLFMCATAACPVGSDATYAEVDFGQPAAPRLVTWSPVARASDAVFRFVDGDAVVARPPPGGRLPAVTELLFLHTGAKLVPYGTLPVNGLVGSVARSGETLLVTGWKTTPATGKQALVHRVALGASPRLLGSVAVGSDWTWSPAFDDDAAVSFDPASSRAALPATTIPTGSGVRSSVEVLALPRGGVRSEASFETDSVDRIVFRDDHLLLFSASGVTVRKLAPEPAR